MRCPKCDHPFSREKVYSYSLSDILLKKSYVCSRCGELIHFFFYFQENVWDSFAWTQTGEKKWAKKISSFCKGKTNCLYIPPESKEIERTIYSFFSVYGEEKTVIFLPEFLECGIKQKEQIFILPSLFFPVSPSYLAEKLILENFPGEKFASSPTLLLFSSFGEKNGD